MLRTVIRWRSPGSGEKRGNIDIYVMPIGAATPLRLTTDPAEDSAPAWSPDGSQIAFVRRQGNAAAIYLTTPPVPNAERKLTDFHPLDILDGPATVSWFPDGKHLVFAETAADGETNGIVMISVERRWRTELLAARVVQTDKVASPQSAGREFGSTP